MKGVLLNPDRPIGGKIDSRENSQKVLPKPLRPIGGTLGEGGRFSGVKSRTLGIFTDPMNRRIRKLRTPIFFCSGRC